MARDNLVKTMVVSPTEYEQSFDKLADAWQKILATPVITKTTDSEHLKDTPKRVSMMYMNELFAGCYQKPEEVLQCGVFTNKKYNQMIFVNSISFVSLCAHHLVPFFGKVHFAYLPGEKIVGLSKIPRLVEVLSRRPQIQEKLTEELVDVFFRTINPKGCGFMVEAVHLCMMIRGVKKETAYTRTTALAGDFYLPLVKDEFLNGVKHNGSLWNF